MKTLLALDTSTPIGSVALLRHAPGSAPELLYSKAFAAGRSHSSQLFTILEEVVGITPAGSLDTIVVGLGPGSYAGVRIGLSAAIGLSLAGGAELLGIPSIVGLKTGSYAVIGDARQESHYLALIEEGLLTAEPTLIPTADLPARLNALPPSLPRYASELSAEQLGQYHAELRQPSAQRLAELALEGKSLIHQTPLEPIYLRAPHITKARAVS